MVQKTTVTLVDDLDGSDADESVKFGLDGMSYEVDLSDTHAGALRNALADYVAHARRTGGRRTPTRRARAANGTPASRPSGAAPATVDREQSKAIREWARSQGLEVSDRGRIPNSVTEAYSRPTESRVTSSRSGSDVPCRAEQDVLTERQRRALSVRCALAGVRQSSLTSS